MEMDATSGLPANAKPFVHPPIARHLAQFSVAFCLAGLVFGLSLPLLRPDGNNLLLVVSCIVGFGAGLYFSVATVRSYRESIVLADDGLRYRSPAHPPVFLRWDEIAAVYPENVMQRLVVEDATGQRKIHIEFHLQDFGELRRVILERATKRKMEPDEAASHAA